MKKLAFIEKLLYAINIVVSLLLVLAIFSSYIPTTIFSVVSLIVPFLVVANVLFFLFWLLRKKKQLLLSFVVLLVAHFSTSSFYKLSSNATKVIGNDDNSLSVMTFNARGFNKFNWIDEPNVDTQIADFIKKYDSDVVCIQEFSRIQRRKLKSYKYRYETPFKSDKVIQAIFSKYPIIDQGTLNFNQTVNNSIFVDVLFNNDTIRVYNVHLQSFKILPNMNTIQNEESGKLLKRIENVFSKQYEQAQMLRKHIDSCRYSKIVMGDFNNTQFSNVYHKIKGKDLIDSYQERGSGFR